MIQNRIIISYPWEVKKTNGKRTSRMELYREVNVVQGQVNNVVQDITRLMTEAR